MDKIKDIFTYYLVRMRSTKKFESCRVHINNFSFLVKDNSIWRYLDELAVAFLTLLQRQSRFVFSR